MPGSLGSPRADMGDEACAPIIPFGGPGVGGCYWLPNSSGTCDKPDPAAREGHPLRSLFIYRPPVVAGTRVGCVLYDENGAVSFNHVAHLRGCALRAAPTPPVMCADGPTETSTGETEIYGLEQKARPSLCG